MAWGAELAALGVVTWRFAEADAGHLVVSAVTGGRMLGVRRHGAKKEAENQD